MLELDVRRVESPTLREEVFHARLPSGLGVSFLPKRGFRKRYACYSTHYGSVDNEFTDGGGRFTRVPDGIAHFLEHTLFETEKGNVSDLFALHGASNNAYTSFTQTTYLFAVGDRFYENLRLLLEFVENPAFHPEKVEKEKGIIEQEIKGYDDSPDWVSYRGLLQNLFHRHAIRIDIAGTAETIRRIDVENLGACYDRFYHPSNMHLFVAGDLDQDELFEFVSAHSRRDRRALGLLERRSPEEPREVCRRETRIAMDVAMPKLLLGFKEVGVPARGKEFIRRELVSQMALELVFGHSSDLFLELYTRELILDDFSASYNAARGIGYAMVGGDTPRPEELKALLLERVERLRTGGTSDADFEREKRKCIGNFVRSFNSLEYIANNYTYFLFHDFDMFQTVDLLAEITREAVEERLQELLDSEASASFLVVPRG